MKAFAAAITTVLVLAACDAAPPGSEYDGPVGDYPGLVPLSPVIARAEAGSTVIPATQALQSRAARLRAKARALRGVDIDTGAARVRALR